MSGTPLLRSYRVTSSQGISGKEVSVSFQEKSARLLDQIAFGNHSSQVSSQTFQKLLTSGKASNLREAFLLLDARQKKELLSRIPEASFHRLVAISEEFQPRLFENRLYAFGMEQLKDGKNEIASAVFNLFVTSSIDSKLREKAQSALHLINGFGSMGDELEHSTTRLIPNTFSLGFIAPMMGAGLIGRSVATWGLGRLAFGTGLTRYLPQIMRHGLGARFSASTLALSFEAPSFVQLSNTYRILNGEKVATDLASFTKESIRAGITLGAMRFSGFLGNQGFLQLHGLNELGVAKNLSRFQRFSQVAIPYTSMYVGMLGGHKFEELFQLRPEVGGMNAMFGTFSSLLNVTLASKLGHIAAGRGFAELERAMGLKAGIYTQALESGFFSSGGISFNGARLAYASANEAKVLRSREHQEAKEQYLHRDPDDPSATGHTTQTRPTRTSGTFRKVSVDQPKLPERTGKATDAQGQIVDPFEPPLSPKRILSLSSEFGNNEALKNLQKEIVDSLRSKSIDEINDKDLGRAFGLSLQDRIERLQTHIDLRNSSSLGIKDLPPDLAREVRTADEIVGFIEYFYRANQIEILESFQSAVNTGTLEYYEPLKDYLRKTLGPFYDPPKGEIAVGDEVLRPHQAVLCKTSGDMMANLRLFAKHIRPDGYSWRLGLFAIARQQSVADEINRDGTYRNNPNLRNIQINFANEPRIIAVGPEGYQGITSELLERIVQLQFVNIPSRSLHDLLSRGNYFRHLPEGAILSQSMGALLGRQYRGIFQPGPRESNTVLPYELIMKAATHFNRPDVTPGTTAGFLNGRELWRGNWDRQRGGRKLRLFFAGPEAGEGSYEAPQAELVARAFTSRKTLNTPHLEARFGHQQRSAELGKAAKNLSTTINGFEAVDWAYKEILARHPKTETEWLAIGEALQSEYNAKIREPNYELMETLLKNNEKDINPTQAEYPAEVRDDYEKSAQINMMEVVKLVRAVLSYKIAERNGYVQFLEKEIVNNSSLASTRNPKRGMMQRIMMIWKEQGCPYRFEEMVPTDGFGKPKMTEEGINSFEPLMELYDHVGHPIERRRLDDRYYQYYKIFFPNSHVILPPKIPHHVLKALNGEFFELSRRKITRNQLEKALEGKGDIEINILEEEFARLAKFSQTKTEKTQQQLELMLELISAMKESNPIGIDRSPVLRHPYGNMFVIHLAEELAKEPDNHRAFIRVDGQGIMDRITQLGMFFRSIPESHRLTLRLNITGIDLKKNPSIREDIQEAAIQIISSFNEDRPNGEIRLFINDTRLEPEINEMGRRSPDQNYFKMLEPLIEKLDASSDHMTPQSLRSKGSFVGRMIDDFLQKTPGWPLNIGYFGGPLQRMLKAAMTRKEKGTPIGIYFGNELIDAFSVYRYIDNHPDRPMTETPMVLSHSIMKRLSAHFKDDPFYQNLTSADYFKGIELNKFIQDYTRYADAKGIKDLRWRVIPIQSLPLERALAGEIKGLNPALLRIYLETEPESQNQMIQEIDPFYEMPFNDRTKQDVKEILQRYLTPFYLEHKERIDQVPLFQFFEQHGDKALPQLIRNGSEF